MTETYDYWAVIDRYYPADRRVREILLDHSRRVAQHALHINRTSNLGLDEKEIETAAMLHDIGIIYTDAPAIDCHGSEPYLCHGSIGANMLRSEGAPEIYASVAERHTGAGLTAEDIREFRLPMPARDMMPRTDLERLICYADCFHSKTRLGQTKTLDQVRAGMATHGPKIVERFETLRESVLRGHDDCF